jgi:hypothetical protein
MPAFRSVQPPNPTSKRVDRRCRIAQCRVPTSAQMTTDVRTSRATDFSQGRTTPVPGRVSSNRHSDGLLGQGPARPATRRALVTTPGAARVSSARRALFGDRGPAEPGAFGPRAASIVAPDCYGERASRHRWVAKSELARRDTPQLWRWHRLAGRVPDRFTMSAVIHESDTRGPGNRVQRRSWAS